MVPPALPPALSSQGDALFLFEHFFEARRAYRRAVQQLPTDGAAAEPAGAGSALPPLPPLPSPPGGLARYLEERLEACGAALQGALGGVLVINDEERWADGRWARGAAAHSAGRFCTAPTSRTVAN
jgi:hypothetical protein